MPSRRTFVSFCSSYFAGLKPELPPLLKTLRKGFSGATPLPASGAARSTAGNWNAMLSAVSSSCPEAGSVLARGLAATPPNGAASPNRRRAVWV
jgi:hypothetical protein